MPVQLLSIGVSNYHTSLFQDLLDFASTTPHIVQNFHDVVTQDVEVGGWVGPTE